MVSFTTMQAVVTKGSALLMRRRTHDLFSGKLTVEEHKKEIEKLTIYQLRFDLKKKG